MYEQAERCRAGTAGRRDFLRVGGLTAFGLGTGGWLPAWGAEPDGSKRARKKSCILIWLDGGPSHLETFDLKPEAPREVRGPFQPISTQVPGIGICELMPQTAKRMQHVAVIRSMTSPLGEHNFGTHYLMTGYKPTPVLEYPAIGSVVAACQDGAGTLPHHIAVPEFRVGGGRFRGNGYLPPTTAPFSVGGDPAKPGFAVRDLDFYPDIDGRRLDRRRRFLAAFDRFHRDTETSDPPENPAFEQAYRMITAKETREAFDLSREPDSLRTRYGRRTIGQSCLLARRLIERGVPFVTVNNTGWDTHQDMYTRLKEGFTGARIPVGLIPSLDLAFSALIDDLRDRGLWEDTLIVVMGEFGRTPKLNTSGGRDHWPRVFSVALAGGPVVGGQAIGKSDDVGESPVDRAVTPADLAATVYTLLGIDPHGEFHTADGRPVAISRDGKLIDELVL